MADREGKEPFGEMPGFVEIDPKIDRGHFYELVYNFPGLLDLLRDESNGDFKFSLLENRETSEIAVATEQEDGSWRVERWTYTAISDGQHRAAFLGRFL